MEGVVGLDELDGVGDLLALEDVVIEVQIRHRLLEHLVVLGSIAFKNGTCGEEGGRGGEGAARRPGVPRRAGQGVRDPHRRQGGGPGI